MLLRECLELEADIRKAREQLIGAKEILYEEMADFVEAAKLERTEARRTIRRARGENVRFSNKVLSLRRKSGVIELRWNEIIYPRGSQKHLLKAIPLKNQKVDLNSIKAKAHLDEVDLLSLHEAKARNYREMYTKLTRASRAIEELVDCYERRTGRKLQRAVEKIEQAERDTAGARGEWREWRGE